jgi:hypothetical protein
MGVRLEDLTPGALVSGVTGDGSVTAVAVRWIGSTALQLTCRKEDGRLDERLLYRDHGPWLTLRRAAAAYDFLRRWRPLQVGRGGIADPVDDNWVRGAAGPDHRHRVLCKTLLENLTRGAAGA